MNIEELSKQLNLTPKEMASIDDWESWREVIEMRDTHILMPDDVKVWSEFCSLSPEDTGVCIAIAKQITNTQALLEFFLYARARIFDAGKNNELLATTNWPDLTRIIGCDGNVLYLLVMLSLIPDMRRVYAEKGIEEEVFRDTCYQFYRYNENYKSGHDGTCGMEVGAYAWCVNYTSANLIRLGRFEYRLLPLPKSVEVYRNKEGGEVLALYRFKAPMTNEGFCAYPPEIGTWKAEFEIMKDKVIGHPVTPQGFVLKKSVSLPLSDWECLLKEGDMILDMHIPSGGGMKLDVCMESMKKARDYFTSHFPETPANAIYCNSWIFNPQLEEILPKSNLTRFMKILYLFPYSFPNPYTGLAFIFNKEYEDWSKAPRNTSLQKGLLDLVDRNIPLRTGGMFILIDDLNAKPGIYRRHWEGLRFEH